MNFVAEKIAEEDHNNIDWEKLGFLFPTRGETGYPRKKSIRHWCIDRSRSIFLVKISGINHRNVTDERFALVTSDSSYHFSSERIEQKPAEKNAVDFLYQVKGISNLPYWRWANDSNHMEAILEEQKNKVRERENLSIREVESIISDALEIFKRYEARGGIRKIDFQFSDSLNFIARHGAN